jgi:uncharacterized protein (TIGR02246 family)
MAPAQQIAGQAVGSGNAAASCPNPAAMRAAQQIVQAWKDGYNSGDAARVAALYTEDAYYLTQHYVTGIVQGRARIQAYVQRGVDAHYRIDSLQILSTGCVENLMYVIARYEAANAGQKAFGVNLVVLKRTAQGWRIVAHEAAVPDPATAVQHLDLPNTR